MPLRRKIKKKTADDVQDNPKIPDIPPYGDERSAPWTQGDQEGGAFQKAAGFTVGFGKTAAQSLAGVMDSAISKHNKNVLEKMRSKKPLFSTRAIGTLYPGLKLIKKSSFNLAADAASESSMNQNMETFVPGSSIRGDAETGQFRSKNYRTEGVLNEDRVFGKQFKRKATTARGGDPTGGTPGNIVRGNTESR